jgi:hypothetical protein
MLRLALIPFSLVALLLMTAGTGVSGAAVRPEIPLVKASASHPCGLLTSKAIKHLVGLQSQSTGLSGGNDPGDVQCSWTLSSSANLAITYEPSISRSDLTAPKSNGELGAKAKKVSGLGGGVAYSVCLQQQGLFPLCDLRANKAGKTFDFELAAPGTAKSLVKTLVKMATQVYGEV